VFGAAAACAVVLGLDTQQTSWALGNASAQAGGLVETLGTMSKSISVGNAARNGLLSSLLAAEGFSGPAAPLEGARGFLRVTSDKPNFAALTAELGHTWALASNTYKPYPCGVVLNPVIEACLALTDGADWRVNDIDRIELSGNPLLRERTDRPDVVTGRTSQVSAQHSVAVTLSRGRAGLAEFSDDAVADSSLREIGRKVVFVDDPSYPVEAVNVAILLRSGRRVSRRVDAAIGSLASPLDDRTLDAKLIACAQYAHASCNTQALLDSVWGFESQQDAALPMHLAAASLSNK
jgi:2-methylcitrate dehydratase PrpD